MAPLKGPCTGSACFWLTRYEEGVYSHTWKYLVGVESQLWPAFSPIYLQAEAQNLRVHPQGYTPEPLQNSTSALSVLGQCSQVAVVSFRGTQAGSVQLHATDRCIKRAGEMWEECSQQRIECRLKTECVYIQKYMYM